MPIIVIFGVVLIALSVLLFVPVVFLWIPRCFLRFQFKGSLRRGMLNEDHTAYIPEQQNMEFVEEYCILKGRDGKKKYSRILLKDHEKDLRFRLYCFDKDGKPFTVLEYNQTKDHPEVILPLPRKTEGLYLDVFNGNPAQEIRYIYLQQKQILTASVVTGIAVTVLVFLFGLGVIWEYGLGLLLPFATPICFMSVLLNVMILVTIVSYLFYKKENRRYLESEDIDNE